MAGSDEREPMLPEYLTVDEVAHLLRTPVASLYQWRYKGYGPPARKVGRKLLYERGEAVRWIEAQTDPNRAA